MIVGSDVNSEVSRHLQSHVRRCREVWLVKRSTDGAKWGRDVGREDLGWLSATEEQHGAYWTTHSWFLSLVRFRCLFCPYISDIIPYFYNNFSLFYLSQRQRASNERNLTITLSLHYVFNSKNSILSVSRLKTLLPSLSLSLPHPNSSFCSITQHVQWSWSLILLLGKKKALKFVFYFPSSYHLLPRYFRASFLVFLFLVFFFFSPVHEKSSILVRYTLNDNYTSHVKFQILQHEYLNTYLSILITDFPPLEANLYRPHHQGLSALWFLVVFSQLGALEGDEREGGTFRYVSP